MERVIDHRKERPVCRDCLYYDVITPHDVKGENGNGLCKKRSPHPHVDSCDWPEVFSEDWCGEGAYRYVEKIILDPKNPNASMCVNDITVERAQKIMAEES